MLNLLRYLVKILYKEKDTCNLWKKFVISSETREQLRDFFFLTLKNRN